MGAWGLDSYANDNTFNHLKAKNQNKPKSNEIEASLDEVLTLSKQRGWLSEKSYLSETYVGILILGLKNNCQVSQKYIKKGITKVKELINDKAYLKRWVNDDNGRSRKEVLENELQILAEALKTSV